MKKIILTVSVLTLLTSLVSAANETTNIRDIKLRYCNGTGSLTQSLLLHTEPNKEEKICVEFSNEGIVNVSVGINFVDGTLTADDDQKKACQPEGTKELFGQYVTGYEKTIIVPKKGKKRITASLKFPEGYAGTSYGCATYFLAEDTGEKVSTTSSNNSTNMFTIFTRVGTFIDAMVDGDFYPELITIPVEGLRFNDRGNNSGFIIYPDGWGYKLRGNIYNTGNISVSGTISIGRSSRRGLFGQERKIYNQTILPRQSKIVDMELPWTATWLFGLNVNTKLGVDYTPIYLGAYNTTDKSQNYSLTTYNKSFFFPWVIVIALIIIQLCIKAYKKLKEKSEKNKSQ